MPITERYEANSGLSQPPAVDVSAGQRAIAQSASLSVRVIDQTGDVFFEQAAEKARVSGSLAGAKAALQRDENGNLLPLTTLPDDATIYGTAYREAAIQNYVAAIDIDAGLKADELARTHASDPEAFRQAWNLYAENSVKLLDQSVAPFTE